MTQENEPLTPMKLRERVNVTQRQIANALDVTVGTVSSWERRLKVPNLTLLEVQQLADLYACSPSELHEAFGPIQVNLSFRELLGFLNVIGLRPDQLGAISTLVDTLREDGFVD